MDWQEYQKIVSRFYAKAEGIGTIFENITLPDKVTGHPRQIDAWLEVETKGHKLGILIDAKFHKDKVNIKDVEEVLALATAVGADKGILVCSNGWTESAREKAEFAGLDLRLFSIEKAVEIIEPNKWMLCPVCENDCIIMDHTIGIDLIGMILWWLAGRCRECKGAVIFCQGCGEEIIIPNRKVASCYCGHRWEVNEKGIFLSPRGHMESIQI